MTNASGSHTDVEGFISLLPKSTIMAQAFFFTFHFQEVKGYPQLASPDPTIFLGKRTRRVDMDKPHPMNPGIPAVTN